MVQIVITLKDGMVASVATDEPVDVVVADFERPLDGLESVSHVVVQNMVHHKEHVAFQLRKKFHKEEGL